MGVLVETANIIARSITGLQPGDSTTVQVERYSLVQGAVEVFLDDALRELGSSLVWENFIFEADDSYDKPLEEIIPLTITRKRS